jgi:hypothetical protein
MRAANVGLASVACMALAMAAQTPAKGKPVVLITGAAETQTAASASGGAGLIGHAVIGSANGSSSTYEHSEVWEVVRRFTQDCPAATFVTNPETPHALTIHVDYQKVPVVLMGDLVIYQLALLDATNNPLFVTKKEKINAEIKPVCKLIAAQK